ncbi:uncharacterized protein LOC106466833 [Limulus polyphemus]|uniref:Uncharacterized protein LOC106466833 n=1 Tax=Limulus polyphemus TaxID=6850 RepID=A0ABM1BIC0_LIMPO|nr:uncharacterized protein LOC106466833 [Limulus polyphemus]
MVVTQCKLLLLLSMVILTFGAQRDCMVDESKGWFVTNNVYQCQESQQCCREYGKPSCCGEKDKTEIIKQQAILWGGLFGFLTLLGLIVFCRRSDIYVLEGAPLSQRCRCCQSHNGNNEKRQMIQEA